MAPQSTADGKVAVFPKWASIVLFITTVAYGIVLIGCTWFPEIWGFSILANFRVHGFTVGIFLFVACGIRSNVKTMIAVVLCQWCYLIPLLPYPTSGDAPNGQSAISVFAHNIQKHPSLTPPQLSAARAADVSLFFEVTPTFATWLESSFPAPCFHRARADGFGVALCSDHSIAPTFPLLEDYPAINVTLRGLEIIGVHLMPPVSPDRARLQQAQIRTLATNAKPHQIIIGDFNATPWAALLRPMLDAGLQTDNYRSGILNTWGDFPVRLPIDLCFFGDRLTLESRRILQKFGSDHHAQRVDFSIAD